MTDLRACLFSVAIVIVATTVLLQLVRTVVATTRKQHLSRLLDQCSQALTGNWLHRPNRKREDAAVTMPKRQFKPTFEIWELPEVLLYQVASFVAPPTERASVLCHKIAPLCKASFKTILEEEKSLSLWQLVLTGDYGVTSNSHGKKATVRSCKRLKRSPVDQVKDAHKLVKTNTEIAYFYLGELCCSVARNSLTRSKLCGILNEYGPNLMLNKVVSSGGTFLVEVCRARNTTQMTILHCLQELIERRGAMVNFPSNESSNSILSPLCVASVRGMPKVVEYLLSKGADQEIPCSARFRLSTNSRKGVRCTNATPIEFARAMMKAEKAEGATEQELRDLNRAIRMLERNLKTLRSRK